MRLFYLLLGFLMFNLINSTSIRAQQMNMRGNGMTFTENKGQLVDAKKNLRPDILFKGEAGGTDVYLRRTGVSYVSNNIAEVMHEVEEEIEKREETLSNHKMPENEELQLKRELLKKESIKLDRIDIDFVNSLVAGQPGSLSSSIVTADQLEGYTNYYYGHCPKGILNVNSYNEVVQKNIYNHIDVKYYGGKGTGLKYDIVVNPGGNPGDIQLKYSGVDKVELLGEKLLIKNLFGTITEQMPKVYQTIQGKIVEVKAAYVLSHDSQQRAIVSFKFHKYNSAFPLVIDPWVTYYGGSSYDAGAAVTADASGNVLITGTTQSIDFPVLTGFQMALNATLYYDAFVVKFDAAGVRQWATYYGGGDYDNGKGITTDTGGNVLLTGSTGSIDFPVVSGYQMSKSIYDDAFIVKFDGSGTRIWATFYGGSDSDESTGIVSDGGNNIFIIGYTYSADFPVFAGFQMSIPGGGDAFVVKFDAAGARLWSTYFGGSDYDLGYGITTDGTGDIYIAGSTSSANLPVLNGYQMALANGMNMNYDGFIAKFSSVGGLIWSTYYGGSNYDLATGIVADGAGNILVTGGTQSLDFPVWAGYQMALSSAGGWSDGDAFVIKFDGSGNRLWATYLGGTQFEEAYGIACDKNNNVVVSGDTYSTDFPTTACAYQNTFIGSEDQYISSFDPNGQLLCSGYLGVGNSSSPNNEDGFIAVSGCYVYLLASTDCNYPVTPGAFQTTCGGNTDCALAKLFLSTCGGINSSLNFNANQTAACIGKGVDFTSTYTSCSSTAGTTYSWSFPGATPASSSVQNPMGITYTVSGTYNVKLLIQTPCGKDSLLKKAYIIVTPCCVLAAGITATTNVLCNAGTNGSASVKISNGSGGPYTYCWSNGPSGTTTSTTISLSGLAASTYSVTITDGACSSISTVAITQPNKLNIGLSKTDIGCLYTEGSVTAKISGGVPNYSYSWSNSVSTATSSTTDQIGNLTPGSYALVLTDGNNCTTSASTSINIVSTGAINVTPAQQTIVEGGSVALIVTGGVSYTWSPSVSLSCSNCANPTATPSKSTTYTLTATDINGCEVIALVSIQVKRNCRADGGDIFIPNVFSPNNDGENDELKIEGNDFASIYWVIYDRWGNLVFETNDQSQVWDGTKNGNTLESGVYVYYLKATCRQGNTEIRLKGNVSLLK